MWYVLEVELPVTRARDVKNFDVVEVDWYCSIDVEMRRDSVCKRPV